MSRTPASSNDRSNLFLRTDAAKGLSLRVVSQRVASGHDEDIRQGQSPSDRSYLCSTDVGGQSCWCRVRRDHHGALLTGLQPVQQPQLRVEQAGRPKSAPAVTATLGRWTVVCFQQPTDLRRLLSVRLCWDGGRASPPRALPSDANDLLSGCRPGYHLKRDGRGPSVPAIVSAAGSRLIQIVSRQTILASGAAGSRLLHHDDGRFQLSASGVRRSWTGANVWAPDGAHGVLEERRLEATMTNHFD